MKLSKAQKEVIEKMKEGWELHVDSFRVWLEKDDEVIELKYADAASLIFERLIRQAYILTLKAKEIS